MEEKKFAGPGIGVIKQWSMAVAIFRVFLPHLPSNTPFYHIKPLLISAQGSGTLVGQKPNVIEPKINTSSGTNFFFSARS